ncbi:MAG: tyrosine-type recombinase/integrase [Akkermansia sp.]|nr:tyrosine-type recombinase/integrase [Akkermansia sp.]
MKNKSIAHELLEGAVVSVNDASRLVLEAIETLGESARGVNRTDLLALLRRVIREGVAAVEAAEHTVSLSEAAWASVEARADLRPSSRRDLRHYVRRILRVEGVAGKPLRAFTTADCRRLLESAFGNSPSSFKKGRAVLSSVFNYGIRQEWVDVNPVSRISVPRVMEKQVLPLTPAEVERLKETARRPEFRDMRFSLSLLLYGGIRPTEVSRLQAGDINWDDEQVIIRPRTSKTGGGRAVPLRGVRGIRKRDRCIPRNWKRRWQALRRAAGFRHWVPDVCRHTFATYHAAMYRNLPELQLEMGHRDTSLLRSRYMIPASRKVAELFWKGCT